MQKIKMQRKKCSTGDHFYHAFAFAYLNKLQNQKVQIIFINHRAHKNDHI